MGTTMTDHKDIQLLHLVIGGDLVDPNRTEFKDLNDVDFVGAYPDYDRLIRRGNLRRSVLWIMPIAVILSFTPMN